MRRLRASLAVAGLAAVVAGGAIVHAPAASADRYNDTCTYAKQHVRVVGDWMTRDAVGDRRSVGGGAPITRAVTVTYENTEVATTDRSVGISFGKLVEVAAESKISVQTSRKVSISDTFTVSTKANEVVYFQATVDYQEVYYFDTWFTPAGKVCMHRSFVARFPVGDGVCAWYVDMSECNPRQPRRSGNGPGTGSTPPSGPAPVTDVRGLPDSTLLHTTDTKRVYKMVGGAPVWQSTCDDGICEGQLRPTSQGVINAGPATPRNDATAVDQRGMVYKFVGGAPLWQDACRAPVNCGTPVKVSNWSIDARDHMNQGPADMQLVQARNGDTNLPVAVTIGSALVPFANPQEVIDTGFGGDWASKVTIISANSYHSLGLDPQDGTLVQGTGGGSSTPVAMIMGQARIPFANPQEVIDVGYGSNWQSKVRAIPTRAFDALSQLPKHGVLFQGAGAGGPTPVAAMVGDARMNFANAQEVIDSGYGTDWTSKVRAIPARAFHALRDGAPVDGTLIQGTNGSTGVAQIVGGARVEFANPQEVIDSGFGENWRQFVRAVPPRAFNLLPTVPSSRTLVRGAAGGTSTGVAQVVGGARILFANESDVAEVFGPDWAKLVRTIPTRAYTAMPTSPPDGVKMLNEAGVIYRAVQGGVEADAHCPEYTEACNSGLPVVLDRQLAGLREYGPAGVAWVDADGDGKADYCRRTGTVNHQDSKVACTLSTGTGYGATITSPVTDWGYLAGRGWADVTGDGKADYCRVVGNNSRTDAYVACTPSTGTGFGATFVSVKLDPGHTVGRTWADVNGDGKADYCRVRGETNHAGGLVSCTPSTGTGFGNDINSTGPLDWGFAAGRAFTDFNGDGKADYCRVVGTENHTKAHVSCTVSNGGDFGQTYISGPTDWGFGADRAWADVNGDKKSDYCRRVGSSAEPRVACTLSTGTGFGTTIVSPLVDWGQAGSRTWTDVNGDGKADFCRVRGNTNHTDAFLSCTPFTGTGFGNDINSNNIDWGFHTGRAWADINGDGKTDYCRRVGGSTNGDRLSCTPSTGGTFGNSHVSGVIDWGLAD